MTSVEIADLIRDTWRQCLDNYISALASDNDEIASYWRGGAETLAAIIRQIARTPTVASPDTDRPASPFAGTLTVQEAGRRWHKDSSTLRYAILDGRLHKDQDCHKYGNQWVVTVAAMSRVFGPAPEPDVAPNLSQSSAQASDAKPVADS